MTLEEINTTIFSIEEKVAEVKGLISDMNVCSNEKSKTILLAAASKLVSTLVSAPLVK